MTTKLGAVNDWIGSRRSLGIGRPRTLNRHGCDTKGLPRNTPPKTEGVDGCCQQGARSENTPVFDRRAT
ncbi:MAG: hypothetical protein ACI8PT_004759, partial [Gammaproteobacteria bacterium]